jgi:hypothetical protein
MPRSLACWIALIGLAVPLPAQTATPDTNTSISLLRINSRAVLVDVIVADSSGKPVTGLPKDAFTVTEHNTPVNDGIGLWKSQNSCAAPSFQPLLKY